MDHNESNITGPSAQTKSPTETGDAIAPATPRFTLRKGEKLRHRSLVEPLFKEGATIYSFPLRLSWRALDGDTLAGTFCHHVPRGIDSLQMLITVPKKKRRHAVDRVLMRRRIREAYRLNRQILKETLRDAPAIATLSMAFIYIHDQNLPYSDIEKKMKTILHKLAKAISAPKDKSAL